ncbi:DUF4440 domain-containing protein [Salinirubrum litoreum]|uniref:DUF4440 domain-containing protein n=1 Tax=Salinirubrum litoreum TaxID=1126234 RepID=A0ABD5RD51_9EURY|nr:DUF4440 domain-containing protein [Salinirubrum litoreum]
MSDSQPAAPPTESACRAEIERLHDRFVAWFTATADEDSFADIADALASDFEMVTPDGNRVGREAVLDSIRAQYGRDDPGTFDIEIRNVDLRHATDDHATVRYEEWQETGGETRSDETTAGETTGRVSTVLFSVDSSATGDLLWVDVHETWLE